MENKTKQYSIEDYEDRCDLVKEPQYKLWFNNGEYERQEPGSLRVLSLFSGCGGMDLGLEGGFICHRKSVTNQDYIQEKVNKNWVLLNKNRFRTVFACDILPEARATWLKYMSRFNVNSDI